jgi:hypothetical protein
MAVRAAASWSPHSFLASRTWELWVTRFLSLARRLSGGVPRRSDTGGSFDSRGSVTATGLAHFGQDTTHPSGGTVESFTTNCPLQFRQATTKRGHLA